LLEGKVHHALQEIPHPQLSIISLNETEYHEYDRPEDDPMYYAPRPSMAPVRGLSHFDDMVKSHVRERSYGGWQEPPLHAALLYTDEDHDLAKYVRLNYKALDRMSGEDCSILVVERPPQSTLSETIDYWKELLAFNAYVLWGSRGWTRTKPYDKAAVYDIARQLRIFPNQLPCVVFFEAMDVEDFDVDAIDVEEREAQDKVVIPIQGELPNFFRVLFGSIQEEHLSPEEERSYYWSDEYMRKLGDIKTKVMSLGTIVSSDQDTVTYSFQGQTVFINKPTGTVQLSDFQNTSEEYEGGSDESPEPGRRSWWRRMFER
jgi:hypothetical protein